MLFFRGVAHIFIFIKIYLCMIVGVTGLIGSGKGAVSNILVAQGFIKLGHSEIISEELTKQGVEINRDNQVLLANKMRKENGNEYWAKKLIEKIQKDKDYVVEGFRNIAEVEEFRKLNNFFLIGIASGRKKRYGWLTERARIGDPKNWEDFLKVENRDFSQNNEYGQQNALCFSSADYYIINENSLYELSRQVALILNKIKNLSED